MTPVQIWHDYGCRSCARWNRQSPGKCEAFPASIPIAIASGQLDHFTTREGDGGLIYAIGSEFKAKLTTPHQDKITAKIVERLRKILPKFRLPKDKS